MSETNHNPDGRPDEEVNLNESMAGRDVTNVTEMFRARSRPTAQALRKVPVSLSHRA